MQTTAEYCRGSYRLLQITVEINVDYCRDDCVDYDRDYCKDSCRLLQVMIEIDVDYNTDYCILTVGIAADCCTEYCREYCRLLQVVGRLQIEIEINTDRIEYTRNIRLVQSEFNRNRMKLMRIHNGTEQNRVEIQAGVEEQINGVALVLKKLTSSSARAPLNMIGVCQHHHLRDTGQSMQEQVGIER